MQQSYKCKEECRRWYAKFDRFPEAFIPNHTARHTQILLYSDVWLTVHRNSVWIRKTN